MSCQVWFSNRRARLRKTAQSCSSPGYNPLALNMSGYSPASYMQVIVKTDDLFAALPQTRAVKRLSLCRAQWAR